MAISGIETLMLLGLVGKANFKAAKDSQECCCFLGKYS